MPEAFFDGSFLTRAVLLWHKRGADAAMQAAIDKALADPEFIDGQVVPLLNAKLGMQAGGGFSGFLALLLQYLPQIIALIMSFFGQPPAPAVV